MLGKSLKGISDEIEIVEGGARGTDALAKRYATEHGIKCHEFSALWDMHGMSAGPIRNSEMVKFISGKNSKAVFFWDEEFSGY